MGFRHIFKISHVHFHSKLPAIIKIAIGIREGKLEIVLRLDF